MKFEEIIKGYFSYVNLNNKINTYNTIKNRVNTYILPYFKDFEINNINSLDIVNWQLELNKLNLSYNYKSSIFYTLTGLLKYIELFYNQDYTFIRKIKNFKNEEIKKGNYFTFDEFNKFISVISNMQHIIIFKMLFYTGIRKAELLGIKKSDIDLNLKQLNINKQLTKEGYIQTPKSKSSVRIISLNDSLCKELDIYFKNYDIKDNDFIFNISCSQLKRVKDNYCKIANVKNITIHEFRHSHAILLFQNNVPIDEISFRLGHSKLSMTTDIYLKYLPKKEKSVILTLNSLFV